MSRRIVVAYHLVADPGAEGDVTLYTVMNGWTFRSDSQTIHFSSGTAGELEITFKRGKLTVIPEEGVFTGEDFTAESNAYAEWDGGGKVLVHYRNLNATASRECYIIVRGILTPQGEGR